MWDLEVLGITDPTDRRKMKAFLKKKHFKETIRICEDQRYEVALSWLAGHSALYDKYDAVESRLRTATKRLINENYFEASDNVFKQWESEGIIKAVSKDQLAKEAHYLPHKPIIKPASNTTKVQIMKEGAFELRCWASNYSKEDQDMQMVLGLSWDVVSDELSCKLPSNLDCTQKRPVTKRVLLSVINSIRSDWLYGSSFIVTKVAYARSLEWKNRLGRGVASRT
ncbi:DUF1758 domain-containing protein [Trichonephila inaurata madagascariensis]|uniref:DUF1758 domain-containing protein n=1 Tax=Trichonephila inaurata madagascariensis TaxID=2747483 RepID=A0A8X7BSC9_9ARAC|nr:DUF1758 domain-containing protein [Trichonephila inaurata madagascariensis]